MVRWIDDHSNYLSDGYVGWLNRYSSLTNKYIRKAVEKHFGIRDQLRDIIMTKPRLGYDVIQDVYRWRDPEQKKRIIYDQALLGSKIIIIVGDRGEGKSVLAWQIASEAVKPRYNRSVYTSYVDDVPPIATRVPSPAACPEGGLYIMDEAHITGLHARRGSTNVALTILNQLSTLRHGGRTFIIITQDSSFIDKNAKSLFNLILFKKLPENASKNMKDLVGDGYDIMLPHNPISTFCKMRDLNIRVDLGKPVWWGDKWSKSFGALTDPRVAKEIMVQMHEGGATPAAIISHLASRTFFIPQVELKQLLYEHDQKLKDKMVPHTISPQTTVSPGMPVPTNIKKMIDKLHGGECSDWTEVYQALVRDGYDITPRNVQDVILELTIERSLMPPGVVANG